MSDFQKFAKCFKDFLGMVPLEHPHGTHGILIPRS